MNKNENVRKRGGLFVIGILTFTCGMIVSYALMNKKFKKQLGAETALSNKHLSLFLLMQQWIRQKIKGRNVADYLRNKGIKTVAIYGMNYVGDALLDDLRAFDIEVKYGIDMNAAHIFSIVPVYHPDDTLPEVDAVIVTAISSFDSIEEKLLPKIDACILSLEDIVYEI